jgi:hypothetical protein
MLGHAFGFRRKIQFRIQYQTQCQIPNHMSVWMSAWLYTLVWVYTQNRIPE